MVLSGWAQSIPLYISILQRLASTGCATVLDCSGEALWQCLGCRPFLIKPNLNELGSLFGVEDLEYAEGVELAHQLQHEGARNVLVSLGADGAFLLTEDQRLFSANAVPGTVRNTVGAGDALIAGFLTGFHESSDYRRRLRHRVRRMAGQQREHLCCPGVYPGGGSDGLKKENSGTPDRGGPLFCAAYFVITGFPSGPRSGVKPAGWPFR